MTPGQQKIIEWRQDPVKFVQENFQVNPDVWQVDGLRAFASGDDDKTRIAFAACAGPGKSALMSWLGWNFLSCYGDRGNHPKGAAVSITADNLADNLWPEYSKWQERSAFLARKFQWTKTRIFAKDHPSTWFMAARSFSKTSNAEEQGRTLSGLHSKYVLAQVDEAGDVPVAVIKAAEQALSTGPEFGKITIAGNPTSHTGLLYATVSVLKHLWHVIRITGDPDDPKRSPRIDIDWAREQIETYGRDNPWVMAYILGLFPKSALNTLLSPDEVAQAASRRIDPTDYEFAQKRLGVDVARFGKDATIIMPRQGLRAFKPVEMLGARTPAIAARVAFAKAKWGSEMEFVDGTGGFGAGVIDALIQAGHAPQEIHFAGAAEDPRYFNKRTEMWFRMAEWVKRGGSIPDHAKLAQELSTPTYYFQNGKMRLEEKDQIIKRLGFSPDRADALALTFALVDMPAAVAIPGMPAQSKLLHEWDPFQERG